jgi:hypothetical protein
VFVPEYRTVADTAPTTVQRTVADTAPTTVQRTVAGSAERFAALQRGEFEATLLQERCEC